jgi:hypothetical protein
MLGLNEDGAAMAGDTALAGATVMLGLANGGVVVPDGFFQKNVRPISISSCIAVLRML